MPSHVAPAEERRKRSLVELKKFGVTRNAFLPADSPATFLSDPYYEPWELIAQHLPQLIEDAAIRDAVSRLPILSVDRLRSEAERRRAYCLLGYITHAYVWGGEKPEEVLPPQITVPFLQLSSHLEIPPVLTYASTALWNFACSGIDFSELEDLTTLFSLTGTESEAWFLLISVAMEAKGAGIIRVMTEAIDAIKSRDYETIVRALEQLRKCIHDAGILLERMYERCDPMVFYHQIRPMLAGSKNMADAGLPRGVFYDEGDGKGEWRQLRGGSNGQSSLIQFFDIVLGVDHKGNGNSTPSPGEESFHSAVREYMPGPHRRFLLHLARMGSIRELALQPATTEEHMRLREAYTAATDELSEFRNKHIKIVTRYIVLPSKQPWRGSRQNLASSSSAAKAPQELTGTGGTLLMSFLKQARDETNHAAGLQGGSGTPHV